MNVKKLAVVLIALIAGGAAFYLTLSGQSDDAPAPVAIVPQTKEETVSVLVADAEIARGDKLSADNTKWVNWPKRAVKDNDTLLTGDQDLVMENLEGSVAKTDFVEGEPLIETKIIRSGSNGLMAAIMTPGMRAVALRVTAETASGGFILPGDHVDVIFTKEGSRGAKTTASTLFRDIKVLAVNEIFSENPESPVIDSVNITLEMTPADAERFVAARSDGKLSLSLRSIFDDGIVTTPKASTQQVKKKSVQPQQKKVRVVRIGRS